MKLAYLSLYIPAIIMFPFLIIADSHGILDNLTIQMMGMATGTYILGVSLGLLLGPLFGKHRPADNSTMKTWTYDEITQPVEARLKNVVECSRELNDIQANTMFLDAMNIVNT